MGAQRQIERRILAQHQVIAERLRADPTRVIGRAQANLARWAGRYSGRPPPQWMREWQSLLEGPVETVLQVLTGADEESVRLRSSSPFAGILSAQERQNIIERVRDGTWTTDGFEDENLPLR